MSDVSQPVSYTHLGAGGQSDSRLCHQWSGDQSRGRYCLCEAAIGGTDRKAAGGCESCLLYTSQEYLDLIDKELAQTIYVGIIHDSGVMQYSNTSPKTLRIVADLISYGFDFPKLIEETFYERTYIPVSYTHLDVYKRQTICNPE